MAEPLDHFPTGRSGFERRPLPPEWFDGRPWKLTKGEDFDVKMPSIQARFNIECRTRGMRGRTRILDADNIVVQMVEPRSESQAA